jgi:hypothetical protein
LPNLEHKNTNIIYPVNNVKINFITFNSMGEPFDFGKNLSKEAKFFENIYFPYFDTFTSYDTEKCIEIDANFVDKYMKYHPSYNNLNHLHVEHQRGTKHGFWLWKPFIIKHHLDKLSDGEILIYQDCNITRYPYYSHNVHEYRNNVYDLFDKLNIDVIIPFENPHYLKSKHHVKKKVFETIGSNNKYYREYPLLNANRIFIRKSDFSVKFINKWLNYCMDEKLLLPEDNILEEKDLKWHTHDQAIVTVLYRKYIEDNLLPNNAPGFYIKDRFFTKSNIMFM